MAMLPSTRDSPTTPETMSNPYAFLRIRIIKFTINNNQQVNLSDVETRVELKEKLRSTRDDLEKPSRVKLPKYIEKEQCIPFDAGLIYKIKRQIVIRIHTQNVTHIFESDLDILRKIADGHRHRLIFTPKAQAEVIIQYKNRSSRDNRICQKRCTEIRYAERRQRVHKHFGHEFVPKIFKLPVFCSVCSEFLWGFAYNGYQCQRCDCVVHRACYNHFACPCKGKKYPDLRIDVPHSFEQQSFSLKPCFCDHCGSFIRPGHAQKCSYCSMVIHRRCISKVGNYCGCADNVLALYQQWRSNHKEPAADYQYNSDLYELYESAGISNQSRTYQQAIARISKMHRPSVTRGFDVKHFQFLRSLGQGMNGSVYLVQNGRNYYAMKVIRKNVVLEGQDLAYVMAEREVMIQCRSNPFIIQLQYAFQNAERLFFLMEVATGGNFYRILTRQAPKPFRYERVVFHVGEITCALMFLHSKRIAYRDLKPENVLIFEDGHLKICDFGLCKCEIDHSPRASTYCGTPEYIAYEICRHSEYDENVDWWSLGVMIYEMFAFTTPFYDDDETQIEDNILYKIVNFPETIPPNAQTIISGLLDREPKQRLGNRNSRYGSISAQKFFTPPYTLENIENQQVAPPWTPSTLLDFQASSEKPRLSELEQKDQVLLMSTPPDTFRGFSYINPNATTTF